MLEYLSENDKKAYSFIRNQIIHFGKQPTLEAINEVIEKSSPRSAVLAIQRLEKAGLLKRRGSHIRLVGSAKDNNNSILTVAIPLVGNVAAGSPILAEQNIEAMIPVSTDLAKRGSQYFLLRIRGSSMNKTRIDQKGALMEDGSIVLVRRQPSADSGKIVVALIDDHATVKTYENKNGIVILKPNSSDPSHKPIILTDNFQIQGVVTAVLPPGL